MKAIPKLTPIKHGWGKNHVAPLLADCISFEEPRSPEDSRSLRRFDYRASKPVEGLR